MELSQIVSGTEDMKISLKKSNVLGEDIFESNSILIR
jgi:hypothetical protein